MPIPTPQSAASQPNCASDPCSVWWMNAMPIAKSTPPPNIDTTSP